MLFTIDTLADALIVGGHAAALENFFLAQDWDVPIFPEALVQVETARALREKLNFSRVELEASTERIVVAASGRSPRDSLFPDIERDGKIDIVCWNGPVPQVFVEVKDQVGSSGDGIVADMLRMQSVLQIAHKWGPRALGSKMPRFGAALYFVGKNANQYKKPRHLASQFIPFANRTVETIVASLRKVVDTTQFDLLVKKARVDASAKDGPPDPELVGTEFEETVSGSEQFTYCVVCVLHRKTVAAYSSPVVGTLEVNPR